MLSRKWYLSFFVFFALLGFSNSSFAQSIGRWQMHEGRGPLGMRCASSHGAISSYAQARIPAYPSGWKNAPNTSSIGFSRRSSLCGRYSCRCGADFTYFRNTVSLPANFNLTKFEIELNGMDDGTRVTIYNSRYPSGVTPSGAYVYLGGRLTQNLRSYAKVGETNIIILTHIDDCCSQSNLRQGYIRVNGKRVSVCTPSAEVCDGRDNDCDGKIDESLSRSCRTACGSGTEVCSAGRWVNCTARQPVAEKCNGKDDDCDGKIDENWSNLHSDCRAGVGDCQRNGKYVCNTAQNGVQCNAKPGSPVAERCDGRDNDCDGRVDENWSNKGKACSVGTGLCKKTGSFVCNATKTNIECSVKAGTPSKEICDGKDNDCDGSVDEMLTQTCKTACESGVETCKAGRWINCTARTPSKEVCDGKDNDCDGKVDENWSNLGQLCSLGTGECKKAGKWVCNAAKTNTSCNAIPGTPSKEVCDGKDNDCDGRVDEDFADLGKACTGGTGACKQTGKKVCKKDGSGTECNAQGSAPKPESCNGLDDDCNGKVDEGLVQACKNDCGTGQETCVAGKWEGCDAPKPSKETCNNKDDDCDGQVDEGLKQECKTDCGKGQETCVAGKWAGCNAPKPQKEECNNKDDDCDGQTDEGLKPRKCSNDCGEGTAVCQNGQWSGCSGPKPQPEVCDGKDNDCDGEIDEKLIKSCSSDCGSGVVYCRNARWSGCTAPRPQQEVCDSKDNDCDGTVDNNVKCPKGQVCQKGACRPFCRNGECPKGSVCKEGVCQGDLCKNKSCPKGQLCTAGQCVDACSLIQCGSGKVCSKGVCVNDDCYVKGCPDKNDVCKEGKCVGDPCDGVTCSSGEFCKDGKCVNSCASVQCKDKELCKEGKCIKDPSKTGDCENVTCNAGEVCIKGKCITDPCKDVQCGKGRVCKDGDCVGSPCLNVKCPKGQVCNEGDCFKPDDPGAGKQDGSTDPDGGTDPDGSTKPDGSVNKDHEPGKDSPVGKDETKSDDKNTGKDEDNPKDANAADKSTGTKGNPDGSGDPGATPGCQCSHSPSAPWTGFVLTFVVLLGLRRRQKESS